MSNKENMGDINQGQNQQSNSEIQMPEFARNVRPAKKRRKRKNSTIRKTLCILSAIILIAGLIGLAIYWFHTSSEKNKLDDMSDFVQNSREDNEYTGEATKDGDTILPQYEKFYTENPDLCGWIKIEDTKVDYPVMHTPDDPEKYIHANFEGEYSYAGLPFMEDACTMESDNLIIYGHNMLDGSMFRTLFDYKDKDFWKEHPIIKFDTLYEEQEYEIMSVFYDRVYYKHEDVFKFYKFIDAENEEEYNDAIKNFREKQLYDTGVVAEYGDQLLTLVTCSYHEDNGRLVVVARRIAE